jgi:hypothetical protein
MKTAKKIKLRLDENFELFRLSEPLVDAYIPTCNYIAVQTVCVSGMELRTRTKLRYISYAYPAKCNGDITPGLWYNKSSVGIDCVRNALMQFGYTLLEGDGDGSS